ncbi:unnamed protein product, partial [Tenebrio molitor]
NQNNQSRVKCRVDVPSVCKLHRQLIKGMVLCIFCKILILSFIISFCIEVRIELRRFKVLSVNKHGLDGVIWASFSKNRYINGVIKTMYYIIYDSKDGLR